MIKSSNDFVKKNIRIEWLLINPYCNHWLQMLLICEDKVKTRPDGKWILIQATNFHVQSKVQLQCYTTRAI
jgi:hypothetical protein